MTDVPDIQTQDDYDEWIDELAETEHEEFVDHFEGELADVDAEDVRVWVDEAPIAFEQEAILRRYRDIVEYAHLAYNQEQVLSLPSDDPLDVAHEYALQCIRRDVTLQLETLLSVRKGVEF